MPLWAIIAYLLLTPVLVWSGVTYVKTALRGGDND